MSMIDDMLADANKRKDKENEIENSIEECISKAKQRTDKYLIKYNCSDIYFKKIYKNSIHSNREEEIYDNALYDELSNKNKSAYLEIFNIIVYDRDLYEKYYNIYGKKAANLDFAQAILHENLHSITETFMSKFLSSYSIDNDSSLSKDIEK